MAQIGTSEWSGRVLCRHRNPVAGGCGRHSTCGLPRMGTPRSAGGGEVCTLLTVATLGGVLACLLRHFRWPLLPQPPLQPSLPAV